MTSSFPLRDVTNKIVPSRTLQKKDSLPLNAAAPGPAPAPTRQVAEPPRYDPARVARVLGAANFRVTHPVPNGHLTTAADRRHFEAQAADEYAASIDECYAQREYLAMPQPGFLDSLTVLNRRMRWILVDWLVEVAFKYRLQNQTLYLAVNLLDRYLSMEPETERKDVQLYGATCMLIAAKYEEIFPPDANEMVSVTDNLYTREDVLAAEVRVLNTLKFTVAVVTPLQLAERFMHVLGMQVDEEAAFVCRYVLELTLLDAQLTQDCAPTLVAASAVYLTRRLYRQQPAWPAELAHHTDLEEMIVKDKAKELYLLTKQVERTSIRRKYMKDQYMAVSKRLATE